MTDLMHYSCSIHTIKTKHTHIKYGLFKYIITYKILANSMVVAYLYDHYTETPDPITVCWESIVLQISRSETRGSVDPVQ